MSPILSFENIPFLYHHHLLFFQFVVHKTNSLVKPVIMDSEKKVVLEQDEHVL